MKVTAPGLIRSTGVAAIAAGLLFVVIQPIHPPDTLHRSRPVLGRPSIRRRS